MGAFIDLTGETFGRLTVIERGPIRQSGGQPVITWLCQCECGNPSYASGALLRKGGTTSCGCVLAEWRRGFGSTFANNSLRHEHRVRHGFNRKGKTQKEYRAWAGAKMRCFNPKHRSYKDYGARGIAMCDRWKNSFEAFISDMGLCPPDKTSIDRIDVNGNYEPGNCRWADDFEQARNRRKRTIA